MVFRPSQAADRRAQRKGASEDEAVARLQQRCLFKRVFYLHKHLWILKKARSTYHKTLPILPSPSCNYVGSGHPCLGWKAGLVPLSTWAWLLLKGWLKSVLERQEHFP